MEGVSGERRPAESQDYFSMMYSTFMALRLSWFMSVDTAVLYSCLPNTFHLAATFLNTGARE